MAASPRVGVSTADRNYLPSLVFLRRTLGGRQAPESAAFFVFVCFPLLFWTSRFVWATRAPPSWLLGWLTNSAKP